MKAFCIRLAPILLVFGISCSAPQKTQESKEAGKLDQKVSPQVASRSTGLSDSEKGMFQKTVEFPSTGEMFEALDKLSNVDWKSVIPDNTDAHYSSKTLQALNLGTRVADGFAAARAKDTAKLEQITQSIDVLAHDLGIPAGLMDKKDSILDDARKGKWVHLRSTLDGMQTGVLKAVDLLGQNDTATLALLGGWIEAMRIATKALSDNYNADASGILYQPALVAQLITRYNTLGADVKSVPAVALIGTKLHEMQSLCNVGVGKPVDKRSVTALQAISSNLAKSITRKA